MMRSEEKELEQRLILIESKIAYHEDSLIKIQEMVNQHQQQLYHMEKKFDKILERLVALQSSENNEPISNEKPPHY